MKQILIVDDDAAFQKAVCQSLSDLGDVRSASSVSEAAVLLNNSPISVIVTDYRLLDRSGYALADLAKQFKPTPPVIVMTAFADKLMAIEAVNKGIYALVEKPFSTDEMRRYVSSALGLSQIPNSSELAIELMPAESSVKIDNEQVKLTRTEFELVALFVSHPNTWLTREAIESKIWPQAKSSSRNILDTHLTNIKRKLAFMKDRLQAIRGRGYILKV